MGNEHLPYSKSGSENDKLVQFCHGSPGVIFTYLKASEIFPKDAARYLNMAEKCADAIWRRGILRKGYGLCHGTSGNAYAFFYM